MRNLKKHASLASLLCLFITNICISQTNPPPPAMPTQQNKIIVDKIIEAAHYKTYVVDYCLTKINEASAKQGWNEQKAMEIQKVSIIKTSEMLFIICSLFMMK